MSKKLELNKAIKIDTIKELMELSVKDSAQRTAFEYRDEKDKFTNCRITAQEENYTAGVSRYSRCFFSDDK